MERSALYADKVVSKTIRVGIRVISAVTAYVHSEEKEGQFLSFLSSVSSSPWPMFSGRSFPFIFSKANLSTSGFLGIVKSTCWGSWNGHRLCKPYLMVPGAPLCPVALSSWASCLREYMVYWKLVFYCLCKNTHGMCFCKSVWMRL